MKPRRFQQLDVFTAEALRGNPLAVVVDGDGLGDAEMAAFARWTNLSETTFLTAPTDPAADYRVRIFTPRRELPFAGHPTLGSCHAWLAAGGVPADAGVVVQQCAAGLVRVRRGQRLAFAAPPLMRSGPLPDELVDRIVAALGLDASDIVGHQWVDNGPGWSALHLRSAAAVLRADPDWRAMDGIKLGLIGPHEAGGDAQFEVRALIGEGSGYEDPVTGSLNAGLAQWLIGSGQAVSPYVAAQGQRLQRAGRVHVWQEGADIWVGGDVTPLIDGTVSL